MSFDMFSGKQSDDMDPNYIYPMPYIDPTMYANPYGMNGSPYSGYQMDPNMAMGSYVTYMNPYMNNPVMSGQQPQNQSNDDDFNFEDMDENMFMQNQMPGMPNMMPNMPGMMMPGMMPMMPMMPQGMMMPGMMPMMPPGMMMPGMMPYMMMPGMPQIHLEEFDEEEM